MSVRQFSVAMAHLAVWGRSVGAALADLNADVAVDRDELDCALAVLAGDTAAAERLVRARIAALEAGAA